MVNNLVPELPIVHTTFLADPNGTTHPPSSSSSHPEPTLHDEIDEQIANPTTKQDLLKKIDVVLKTATPVQREALKALHQIVNELDVEQNEGINCRFYNKLVNQVICGKRTKATLANKVDDVNGVPHMIARSYNLPLPTVSTCTLAEPKKPRFGGTR